MPRIAGVVLPDNKRVVIGLTYIYGIGVARSQKILKDAKVDESVRVKDLTEDQENAIRQQVEKYRTEGDLQREVYGNIKRLQDINCYRGTRHKKKLPVRGQRTKTNARTRKGKVKTMGSGRVKEQKK